METQPAAKIILSLYLNTDRKAKCWRTEEAVKYHTSEFIWTNFHLFQM